MGRHSTRNPSRQSTPEVVSSNDMQNVNIQSSRNFFNINIQNFDGEPSMVEFFFSQLEDLIKFNNYNDAQALAILKSKLVGNALEFYLTDNELKNATSIAKAKEILTHFFTPSAIKVSASEFNNIRLLPGENIKHLVYRLNSMASKVYPKIQGSALDEIKLVQFIASLPPDIKCKIHENNINDYQEAIKFAQNVQDAQIASCIAPSTSQVNFLDQINEIVYLKSKDKYKPKFTGPYEVLERCNDWNYIIRFAGDTEARSFKVHVDRLRSAPQRMQYLTTSNFFEFQKHKVKQNQYSLRDRQ